MSTLAEQTDERFMRIALGEANKAAMLGEVPIGAVVASGSGTIIGRGHNLTERLCDVTHMPKYRPSRPRHRQWEANTWTTARYTSP